MNEIISTKEQVFIALVGPIGSGKSHLIFEWLKNGTFQPKFDKFFYFYQHYQPLYGQMQRKNLKFIHGRLPTTRRAKGYSKSRRSKLSKRNNRTHT